MHSNKGIRKKKICESKTKLTATVLKQDTNTQAIKNKNKTKNASFNETIQNVCRFGGLLPFFKTTKQRFNDDK